MEKCLKNISDQLHKSIAEHGWSIVVASGLLGIHRNELYEILNCKKDIKISTLVRISSGIEKPVSALVSSDEARKLENEELLKKVYEDLKYQLRKGNIM